MRVVPALSVQQLAMILGVSPAAIRRLAASKVLPSFRVGKVSRFYVPDVVKHFNVDPSLFEQFFKEIT